MPSMQNLLSDKVLHLEKKCLNFSFCLMAEQMVIVVGPKRKYKATETWPANVVGRFQSGGGYGICVNTLF